MGRGTDEMIALHDAIDRALEPLGFRSENRRFRPHITIGRVRKSSAEGIAELGHVVREHAEFDGGLTSVFEVTVFSSELHRGGPSYTPLGYAALRGQ
jgi:2'-5' RNA ligase